MIPPRKILITGSSGFLGRYLIRYAPETDVEIFAQYRSEVPDTFGRQVQFFQMDFLDEDWSQVESLQPDLIIHCAALSSADECELKKEIATHINVESTRRLVALARRHGARFIYLSSDLVFDGKKGNYSESDVPNAINMYAHTKLEAEKTVLAAGKNGVVVRPAIFYGLGLGKIRSFTEQMRIRLSEGERIQLFTDQFRTPILVDNLAQAIWELAGNDYSGVLHLGGPQRIDRFSMGKLMCDQLGFDKRLLIPTRLADVDLMAPRPLDCSLDSSLARKLLKTRLLDCRKGFRFTYG